MGIGQVGQPIPISHIGTGDGLDIHQFGKWRACPSAIQSRYGY